MVSTSDMLDEFDELNANSNQTVDNVTRNLYDKISTLPVKSWIPLENKFYRMTKMGGMTFADTGFSDQPNLGYFHHTQAKNGGPIGKPSNPLIFVVQRS